VLKAIDLYHRLFELPFAGESSELFDRPSINLGRIGGGDVVNRVPDHCALELCVRYLPTQQPEEVLRQVRSLDAEVKVSYHLPPATLNPRNRYVQELRHAVRAHQNGKALVVGRHGASDAVFFLARGIPSVEFGPAGAGHHGPDEHVTISSLRTYRRILVELVRRVANGEPPAG
jgi:succinyl-diaminopimelate desuccinylase